MVGWEHRSASASLPIPTGASSSICESRRSVAAGTSARLTRLTARPSRAEYITSAAMALSASSGLIDWLTQAIYIGSLCMSTAPRARTRRVDRISARGRAGSTAFRGEDAPGQISSGNIWMAPEGHSATQMPQPLQ